MGRLRTTAVPLAFVLAFGVAAVSEAAPIVGSLSKTGCDLPVNAAGTTVNSDVATGVNFTDLVGLVCVADSYGNPGTFGINAATGDFTSVLGQTGQVSDFQFGGPYPIASFETLGAPTQFTFSATGISGLTQMYNGTIGAINFTLSGIFTSTNPAFDPTPGTAIFTLNQSTSGTQSTFTFSSSQASTPVPEPGSLMLLGSGLFGAASALRRRRLARG